MIKTSRTYRISGLSYPKGISSSEKRYLANLNRDLCRCVVFLKKYRKNSSFFHKKRVFFGKR